jgi:hypothetical protein
MPNYHRAYRKGEGVGRWRSVRTGSVVRVQYEPAAAVAAPVSFEPVETVAAAPVVADELVATATETKPKKPRKPRKKKSDG